VEKHSGNLMLSKLQAQPDPACHATSTTSHPPREITNPDMPSVSLQQFEDIERGRMPAAAGRPDRSHRPDKVSDPCRVERDHSPRIVRVLFSHNGSMRPTAAVVNHLGQHAQHKRAAILSPAPQSFTNPAPPSQLRTRPAR
jgi:hypothetical protein